MAYRSILFLLAGLFVADAGYPQATPTKDEQSETARVSFERGTLSEYVARLRSHWPDANIVIDRDAGAVPLPSVSLGKASLAQAVRWVEGTADARKASVVLQTYRIAREPGDVYLFTKGRSTSVQTEAPSADVLTYEFPAGADEALNKPEKIQIAIDNMLKASDGPKGTVTLDPKLPQLIVKGAPEDLRRAREIIARMSLENAETPLRREVDQLRRDIEQLRRQLEVRKPEAKAADQARR